MSSRSRRSCNGWKHREKTVEAEAGVRLKRIRELFHTDAKIKQALPIATTGVALAAYDFADVLRLRRNEAAHTRPAYDFEHADEMRSFSSWPDITSQGSGRSPGSSLIDRCGAFGAANVERNATGAGAGAGLVGGCATGPIRPLLAALVDCEPRGQFRNAAADRAELVVELAARPGPSAPRSPSAGPGRRRRRARQREQRASPAVAIAVVLSLAEAAHLHPARALARLAWHIGKESA
jgi:hypothetical protein